MWPDLKIMINCVAVVAGPQEISCCGAYHVVSVLLLDEINKQQGLLLH